MLVKIITFIIAGFSFFYFKPFHTRVTPQQDLQTEIAKTTTTPEESNQTHSNTNSSKASHEKNVQNTEAVKKPSPTLPLPKQESPRISKSQPEKLNSPKTKEPIQQDKRNPKQEESKPNKFCETDRLSLNIGFRSQWSQSLLFPVKGFFVTESHYLTTQDSKDIRQSAYDDIENHLKISCALYNQKVEKVDCNKLYNNKYVKQWTPAEGGHIGSGSITLAYQQQYLSPWMEMWMATMMWKSGRDRPKPGEKFLIINPANHRKVVVQMGFETGPSSHRWIGGMVAETSYYLQSTHDTKLLVYHLTDKATPLGPTHCEVK